MGPEIVEMEKWGFQCGYCTPGFILNCQALVDTHSNAADEVMEEVIWGFS